MSKPDCHKATCGWSESHQICIWLNCIHGKAKPVIPRYEESPTMTEPLIYSHSKWDALLDQTIAEIKKLSVAKGGEYAGDSDRLANFRRNGANLGLPMETIWAVYAGKHWDAIMQYIRDERKGKTRTRLEPIAGRVDDLLVYLLLLKAMLDESTKPEGPANV